MLEGFGKMLASIIGALMPWVVVAGLLYVGIVYGWPRAETFWNEREAAYANQPKLLAVIAQDKLDIAAAKTSCRATAARVSRNSALINSFANRPAKAGQAPGLNASDISELLR